MTVNKESGFTLVEMLVTMAIFGIILGGILKVYDTNNYTYKVQEEVVAMHQNIRVAKMFLERDIRMAGCGMGEKFGYGGVTTYAVENTDGVENPDRIMLHFIDYSMTDCDGVLPDLTLTGEMPASSSEATMVEDMDYAPYDAWGEEFVCNGTTYGDVPPFVPFPAIIISPDGKRSEMVWVTTVQLNSDKVQNAPYPGGCSVDETTTCNKVINGYPAGSTLKFFDVAKLRGYVYYLLNGVLMRDTIERDPLNPDGIITSSDPIAEDIDDLQFSFGLDRDGDGDVDGDDDPWVDSTDLTNDEKPQVRLVKIEILGRTASEHRGFKNTLKLDLNPAAAVNDGFRRKPITVTVKVRNMGL